MIKTNNKALLFRALMHSSLPCRRGTAKGRIPGDASGDSAANLMVSRRHLRRKIRQAGRGCPSREYRAE
jgi:hypothetical protein